MPVGLCVWFPLACFALLSPTVEQACSTFHTVSVFSYPQVVAAPNVDIPQVQAAQEFKELADKVANERSLKRQETAAAGRGGRGGRGGRSKSPSRPSSRSGGRGGNPSVPPVRKGSGGGGKQRRQSTGSGSSDSSSRQRRTSHSGTKKRPTNREVGRSAGDEEGGEREQARSDEAETPAEVAPTLGSRGGAAAVEVDSGNPKQQEEGRSSPAGAVADEAGAPSVGDEQVEDTAEAPQHQGGSTEEEAVLVSERSRDDDVGEASRDTEKVDLLKDTSVPDGASLARSASAAEVTKLVALPKVQEDPSLASATALSQDEGDNEPRASASSTTQGSSGQVESPRQQERGEQLQQGGSTPAPAETKTLIPQQLNAAADENRQNHQENSRAGEGGNADSCEETEPDETLGVPKRTANNGADGGLRSETKKSRQRSSAAAIEFVPTERSLAAFCKVRSTMWRRSLTVCACLLPVKRNSRLARRAVCDCENQGK